jgi:hypothetical protein
MGLRLNPQLQRGGYDNILSVAACKCLRQPGGGGWVQNSDGMLNGRKKVKKFRDQVVLKLFHTPRKR